MSINYFFGGDNSALSFIILMIFLFLYPRLYIWQMVAKLEMQLKKLEEYDKKSEGFILKRITKKPNKTLRSNIKNFMDFFISTPVTLDPYGIVKKIEHILNECDRRFNYFVKKIAPSFNRDDKENLKFGLIGAMGTHQIYKIIRHYVITIKKTHNLQLAMILQMIMPDLMKLAKANVKATKAFVSGIPIGDAIGALVAASFKAKEGKKMLEYIVVSEEKVGKKKVFVMKSNGPAASIGGAKTGHAVEKLYKKYRINHIITIDAGGKLEGEKTGTVVEGVGVAMGGVGVERSQIEDIAVRYDIPLDGVVIKVAPEEASIPLKKEVYNAIGRSREIVERIVNESESKKVLIIGVGNTCGVGNTKDSIKGLDKKLKPIWKQQKREKELEKKKIRKFFGIGKIF